MYGDISRNKRVFASRTQLTLSAIIAHSHRSPSNSANNWIIKRNQENWLRDYHASRNARGLGQTVLDMISTINLFKSSEFPLPGLRLGMWTSKHKATWQHFWCWARHIPRELNQYHGCWCPVIHKIRFQPLSYRRFSSSLLWFHRIYKSEYAQMSSVIWKE